jgi:hypothetical protein
MIPSSIDLYNLEKRAAGRSVTSIRYGIKSAINQTTNSKSGLALSSAGARSVFKDNRLQRIALKAQHYIFKQHHGFEGNKKNGIMMRLKQTSVITKALDDSKILETLADELSEIRLSEVTSRINFK